MSSIYRKGRDGYYYYQTYIYNPKSKKKDKRIFHSLGTKNSLEAKEKQIVFDKKYQNQIFNNSSSKSLLNNFILKSRTSLFISIIVITIILIYNFSSVHLSKDSNNVAILPKVVVNNQESDYLINVIPSKKPNIKKPNHQASKDSLEKNKTKIDTKQTMSNVKIPKYNIERIDRLSNAFKQIKVFVTLDKKSSIESQRLLCVNLAKRFNEFPNILICLYADNPSGKDLANGNDEFVSVEDQKRSWLAMYSYNSVEGEYFDDSPSSYLGAY